MSYVRVLAEGHRLCHMLLPSLLYISTLLAQFWITRRRAAARCTCARPAKHDNLMLRTRGATSPSLQVEAIPYPKVRQ
jgi:hypothetical protein